MAPKVKGRYLESHELWKQAFAASSLSYSLAAKELGCSKALVSEFFNKGYLPARIPNFLERMEAFLRGNGVIDNGEMPRGRAKKQYWEEHEKMKDEHKIERQALNRRTLKHFGLRWDPFYEKHEPFISKEFRMVADDLVDCIERHLFTAVIGQVGWGKTTLLAHVKQSITEKMPHVLLAEVATNDAGEIQAKHVRDAIMEAIDAELQGTRQKRGTLFRRVLEGMREQGRIVTVLIDDAQWLAPKMFGQLKLFSEMQEGYRRLVGIVLVGQEPELDHRLNAIRAAGWRANRIRLHGLGAESKAYIEQRLKVAGGRPSDVITPAALDRLCEIMRQKRFDYPLPLSALMSLMMTKCHALGEARIPKEMVEQFFTPSQIGYAETAKQRDMRRLSPELNGESRFAEEQAKRTA